MFVLTMVPGPAWDGARGIREQDGWVEHAAFMDGLVDAGLIVLGGPIGAGTDVMLVVDARDETAARAPFRDDPWHRVGLLEIGALRPWTIWLDGRPSGQ